MGRSQAPVLDVDPFDPDVLVDPYAFHQRMRDAGPVVFLERYGVWALARHAEVAEAPGHHLLDPVVGVDHVGRDD